MSVLLYTDNHLTLHGQITCRARPIIKRGLNALLLLVALTPGLLFGFELGNLQLNSFLNQPLDAEIKLVNVDASLLQDLQIKLADAAVYESMGVTYDSGVAQAKLVVELLTDGQYVIRLQTVNDLTEPFINLLLEMNWSSGTLLREFAAILDDPLMLGAVDSAAFFEPTAELIVASAAGGIVVNEQPSPAVRYRHEVKKSDSLSQIANALRPPNISVEQMMLALQRENPHAFYGDTISHLKLGAVLRLDDTAVLDDISVEAASAEINRQYAVWSAEQLARREKKRALLIELETPPEAVTKATTQEAPDQAQFSQLSAELALTKEAMEASKQENQKLVDRLLSLEQEILQRNALQQQQEADTPLDKPIDLVSENVDEQPVSNQAAIMQDDKLVPNIDAPTESLPEPITESQENNAFFIIGILFFSAILVVGGFFWRKSVAKAAGNDAANIQAEKSIDELFEEELNDANRTRITERLDQFELSERVNLDPLTEIHFASTQITASDEALRDPIAEADAYLCYDKFDSAEALLNTAIDDYPDRQELKLKLLEVYAKKQDLDAFDNAADILSAAISADESNPLWQKACLLANDVGSDNPIFSGISGANHKSSISGEVKSSMSEFFVKEKYLEQKAKSNELFPSEPSVIEQAISDDELKKAMASFTDEALHAISTKEDLAKQEHAVPDMLSSLQVFESDKNFSDEKHTESSNLFSVSEEIDSKLDLAKAYIEMGDREGAKTLLEQVLDEGSLRQKQQAMELMPQK